MISEFITGIRFLGRGFAYWRTRPGLMALGLIPGLISLIVLAAALVPLLASLGVITDWATPFADGWTPFWRNALRVAFGIVITIAALVLAGMTFTALTLLIGDPFYQRIWRAVENDLGGDVPEGDGGFLVALGESIRLVVLGVLVALLALAIGFIPLIGAPAAAVTSVLLTGRILARELTGRALNARDMASFDRSQLFAANRGRLLGFGAATQLCFMVPLGAVFIMPTAVVGATLLARQVLDTPALRPTSPPHA
ncbi:EI24 domain-containing protein [Microbacterium esteraromaticum]|uniref:EI24 domain-containing protein n=1 Tax=Microbacterium esteraromaticum TaxID=57043 RepID=UPI0027DC364F|nr:EI24 domain-containing protein [Microbacterium esteraromaticum]